MGYMKRHTNNNFSSGYFIRVSVFFYFLVKLGSKNVNCVIQLKNINVGGKCGKCGKCGTKINVGGKCGKFVSKCVSL